MKTKNVAFIPLRCSNQFLLWFFFPVWSLRCGNQIRFGDWKKIENNFMGQNQRAVPPHAIPSQSRKHTFRCVEDYAHLWCTLLCTEINWYTLKISISSKGMCSLVLSERDCKCHGFESAQLFSGCYLSGSREGTPVAFFCLSVSNLWGSFSNKSYITNTVTEAPTQWKWSFFPHWKDFVFFTGYRLL